MLSETELDGFLERPRAIGVECDARCGEAFGERGDGLHLLGSGEYAALELEVVEAVAGLRGFGESEDCCGGEGFIVAQAEPVIGCVGFATVGQVGFVAVANVEEVAEDVDLGALLAFA